MFVTLGTGRYFSQNVPPCRPAIPVVERNKERKDRRPCVSQYETPKLKYQLLHTCVHMCQRTPKADKSSAVTKKNTMFRTLNLLPFSCQRSVNTLNAKLNPICHLLALLEAHNILHFSRIRIKFHLPYAGITRSSPYSPR